jgi:GTPase SAR1 family protein
MFVGDNGVGKTSLIYSLMYENESFIPRPEPTNDVDIFFKKMTIKDGNLLVNVI